MPNRLAHETSPYLLQHKDNPVDWYPWGEEAFERARKEGLPIFLSIGYSACHWCHVMAHESFEDEATAAFMNKHFVNIKVDREERPDVDSIYMSAVQAITGGGGWPMSVFLLPDGRPFYGGTYFPKSPRYGMPSFMDVLRRVSDVYRTNQAALERDAGELARAIGRTISLGSDQTDSHLSDSIFQAAFQALAAHFDAQWGGFGSQPKFPPSMTLELLFRLYHRYGWKHALAMATHTLDRMAWGGIYDQLGGGFHRYSVDNRWLVPHFEKMLYDNALLIRAYLYGYQITGIARYRQVVEEVIAYVQREMTHPSGGFYSSQDADSEGREGHFFVWEQSELRAVLDGHVDAEMVLDYWGVTERPNFEGRSILWVPHPPDEVAGRRGIAVDTLLAEVERARAILFAAREGRPRPGRDDKVLTAWNGLMIKSLAEAGRVLGRSDYTQMAVRAANFLLTALRHGGRLLRSYKDGQARFNAYLEDYAFLAEALIELYQSTFDRRWFEEALALTEAINRYFWDDEAGFLDTSHDHENLIARPQELSDNATPSGTSSAIAVLVRMAILADRPEWRRQAERIFSRLAPAIQAYPSAFSYLASQLDFALSRPHEIALVGDASGEDMAALLEVIRKPYRPNQVVALRSEGDERSAELIPLLANRKQLDGRATAYVCQNFSCRLPLTSARALSEELERPAGA